MTEASDERTGTASSGAVPQRMAKGAGKDGGAVAEKAPVKAKVKSARKKGTGKPHRESLAAELALELDRVRAALKESSEQLMTRLDGELAALSLYLNGQGVPEEKPVLPPARVLSQMIAEAKTLKVKPKKGRVKDLGRMEALLDSLAAKMPPGM
jgi:hypothetical protein